VLSASVSTTIFRVTILIYHGLITEVFGEMLCAAAILHAGRVGIYITTGAMGHHRDQSEQPWMGEGIRKLCRDHKVYLSRGPNLIIPVEPYEEMHVRKTSLLKFNSVHASEGGAKEPHVLNEFDQMLLLLVKDM
jgi:hypothetical protein